MAIQEFEHLKQALARHSPEVRGLLEAAQSPALPPAIAELCQQEELTEWFMTFGTTVDVPFGPRAHLITPTRALAEKDLHTSVLEVMAGGDLPETPDPRLAAWSREWLPIVAHDDGSCVVADCGRPAVSQVTVFYVRYDQDLPRPVVPSLRLAAARWTELIEDGSWLWNEAESSWVRGRPVAASAVTW